MSSNGGESNESNAPTPTDAAEARRKALLAGHERYIKSVLTSRTLPHIQSSVAGAGGNTWHKAREVTARNRTREEQWEVDAAEQAARDKAKAELGSRASELDAAAARRKAQRDKKKKGKKATDGAEVPAEAAAAAAVAAASSEQQGDAKEDAAGASGGAKESSGSRAGSTS